MPIYTSNFARASLLPPDIRPVSIARWPPRSWGQRARCLALAPLADLIRAFQDDDITWDRFAMRFREQLDTLDPAAIAHQLGDQAALLCHCPLRQYCHRRLVAEWLEPQLGTITELEPFGAEVLAVDLEALAVQALTVRQPWASEIIAGVKVVEYRSWKPSLPLPFTLAIHAAKRPAGEPLPLGAILGTVAVVEAVQEAPRQWEWRLANPRPLAKPITCPGQLGLWTLPADVAQQLAEQC